MELDLAMLRADLRRQNVDVPLLETAADLRIEEIGDGNLNTVYRVSEASHPERSLVLKHAPPYIKILGPEYPLSTERLTYEARALAVYNRLARGSVPTLYAYDAEQSVIVMEDLRGATLLRDTLIAGRVEPLIAEQIGEFLGRVHSETYTDTLDDTARQQYRQQFANTSMQSITADYVFTFPFTEHETNFWTPGLEPDIQHLKADTDFLEKTETLKQVFLTAQQALVHGDMHTGSVLVQNGTAKVFDAEFAFYGPIGFDLGMCWANYLLSYFSHPNAAAVQSAIKTGLTKMWERYTRAFGAAEPVFSEAVGFAGLEMLRRIIGAAHVQDIERIADVPKKLGIESAVLQFGGTLVKQSHALRDMPAVLARL